MSFLELLRKFKRQARQIFSDPTLRIWLWKKFFRQTSDHPKFRPNWPSYLYGKLPLKREVPVLSYKEVVFPYPQTSISLDLAGKQVVIEPGAEKTIFDRVFDNTEHLLALHRFAWVDDKSDPAWVGLIWRTWINKYTELSEAWPWHPYTAAERVVNMLQFFKNSGVPSPIEKTKYILALHAQAIVEKLEFNGDHNTSNHLANNGRGLYFLGLECQMPVTANLGSSILIEEAKRIFLPSGVLREGSSHYHLLLCKNYYQVYLISVAFKRSEASVFKEVVKKAKDVASALMLPGGFPLIGDISPDVNPEKLKLVMRLNYGNMMPGLETDGWLKHSAEGWSGLWHATPQGWSHTPGHGHEDLGSFELHYNDEAVLIDPGRGIYDDSRLSRFYTLSDFHNCITISGLKSYPKNRPYYSSDFKLELGYPLPKLMVSGGRVTLKHGGYSRYKGVGNIERQWEFNIKKMILFDQIEGQRICNVCRTFITPFPVLLVDNSILIKGLKNQFILRWSNLKTEAIIKPIKRWVAYGTAKPAFLVCLISKEKLPMIENVSLEVHPHAS